ncbi:hypothetical protein GCM10022223_12920 [Kineosporia mesophila]|uniref:Uncharacterized protein n=1 Tax=Kineosporia mesophila TaxID=566012 RepID=A0ABP6Z5V0_9ACTN|nr:hypothetical protein [Kineosporia mesophila]MCD5354973.1 hypothetical protein [Kineosporia mesophila]
MSREHGDIDVSTLRPLLPVLLGRLPRTLVPFAAMSGRVRPLFQHLDDPLLHNIWVHDHLTRRWVLQINLENGDDEHWAYRRHPDITLPWHRAVQPVDGVPTGSPATQLLWKAKSPRAVDEHDRAVTHLSAEDQAWLQHSIRTAHPDSPWALRHTDT